MDKTKPRYRIPRKKKKSFNKWMKENIRSVTGQGLTPLNFKILMYGMYKNRFDTRLYHILHHSK